MQFKHAQPLRIRDAIFFVIAVTTPVVLFFFAIELIAKYACEYRAEQMGVASKHGILTGCMIEYVPGKYLPLEQFRGGLQ